jgi:hypothetical protein
MGLLAILAGAAISAIVLSLGIAALVQLDVSLAARLLIVAGALATATVLGYLQHIVNLLAKIYLSGRLNFIAIEDLRRHPNDATPARDILITDMREETELDNAGKRIAHTGWMQLTFWVVWVILVVVDTLIILYFWK